MKKYTINYKGWSDEASPIKDDVKIKTSHAKLVANAQIAERNKEQKFRDKVSKGVKKHFGSAIERFNNVIVKQNKCWIYSKRWINDDNGKQIQPKTFSAIIHNVDFPSGCLTQTCGNSKCVNPNHLIDFPKKEQALNAVKNRKKISRGNVHPSKLSIKDVNDIKKMYNKIFKKTGKHKGIATEIHKVYHTVTLSAICQIIKPLK